MDDVDTREVMDRLDAALEASGLSMRQFSAALGTSASRYSSYRSGKVGPSAAFLLRSERIAAALRQARRDNLPSSIDAARSIDRAVRGGDPDWTYAVTLEARDRVRDILQRHRYSVAAWDARPPTGLDGRWLSLLAAFVGHEFSMADLLPPAWTDKPRLEDEWILDTPRLGDDDIKRQTPDWLASRNIFVAAKDLVTR